jgi:DNA (cytosine-5)-methyltransferase 1
VSPDRPWLLDLFCGAGGCAKGYQRAGFYVVGVDIEPQPNYCGDEFVQADALDPPVLWDDFAAAHASPPCQFATDYQRRPGHVRRSPNVIPAAREILRASGLPYVIENVTKARAHLLEPIQLCGSSFGLDVQRHRLFECPFPIMARPCDHSWQTPRFPAATNRQRNSRRTVEVGVWRVPLEIQQRAMGIDWMTREELSQAIPPAYTEHIGHYLMAEIKARAARRLWGTPQAAP